jgi:hypothetical protein
MAAATAQKSGMPINAALGYECDERAGGDADADRDTS